MGQLNEIFKNADDNMFAKKLDTLKSQWVTPATPPVAHKTTPLRFTFPRTKESRVLEEAIFNHVINQLDYGAEKFPEERKKDLKLLRHYIELYVWDPNRYPTDVGNPIHVAVHRAGAAVMAKNRFERLMAGS